MSIVYTGYDYFSKFLHIDNETGAIYYQDKRISDDCLHNMFIDRHNTQESLVASYQVPYNKPSPKILAFRYRAKVIGFQGSSPTSYRTPTRLYIKYYDDSNRVLRSGNIFDYYINITTLSHVITKDIIDLDIVIIFDYPVSSVQKFEVILNANSNDDRYFVVGQTFNIYNTLEC